MLVVCRMFHLDVCSIRTKVYHEMHIWQYTFQHSMPRALHTTWPMTTTCGTTSTSPLSWTGRIPMIRMPYSSLCTIRYGLQDNEKRVLEKIMCLCRWIASDAVGNDILILTNYILYTLQLVVNLITIHSNNSKLKVYIWVKQKVKVTLLHLQMLFYKVLGMTIQ